MVAFVDLIVFTLKIASWSEANAMSFSEIEYCIDRAVKSGALKRK